MNSGIVFDIKEFAVFDGPGIRTTAFLKGCPLECTWCHNPEGQNPACEEMLIGNTKTKRISGRSYIVDELCQRLRKNQRIFELTEGGITFSGGEPLVQHDFLSECLSKLTGIHLAIETSGYSQPGVFQQIASLLNLMILDLKVIDDTQHRKYTGVSNRLILENLNWLMKTEIPFIVRVPLIPGVSDSYENLEATALLLQGAKNLELVELLPYHITAGAKYPLLQRDYKPLFDEEQPLNMNRSPFTELGIPCRIL